jgi:hypothetical protein
MIRIIELYHLVIQTKYFLKNKKKIKKVDRVLSYLVWIFIWWIIFYTRTIKNNSENDKCLNKENLYNQHNNK